MAVEDEVPSAGEIFRRLTGLVEDLKDTKDKLDESYVTKEVFELEKKIYQRDNADLTKRILSLESDRQWLIRSVLGAIVLLLLGAAFTAARLTGG